MKSILIVATSHNQLGSSGCATGLWLEEFQAPFRFWRKRGFGITVASPHGGEVPVDPASLENGEAPTPSVSEALAHTVKLSCVSGDGFDAVFFPGGHGPLWDLAVSRDVRALLGEFARQGKIIAAVCHGPAAFLAAAEDGLLQDVKMTGFSNAEEKLVKKETIVPFLLEDALREAGAHYSCAAPWREYVVRDGRWITGQNPQSSRLLASHLAEMLDDF